MENAFCTPDNTTYSAEEFSEFPANDIAAKRRDLKCIECGSIAYFTKAISGRAAFFGSRAHLEDCTESRRDTVNTIQVDAETMLAQRIVVTFGVKHANKEVHEQSSGRTSKQRFSVAFVGEGQSSGKVIERNVDGLLRVLIAVPDFQQSTTLIAIDGEEIPASEFFIPLSAVEREHAGKTRGFWGKIYNGAFPPGGWLWLNRDNNTECAIGLRSELRAEAEDRFGFSSSKDLTNAYVLVIGTFSPWLKCKPKDIEHIAIQPIRIPQPIRSSGKL